jgi:hypothetical protein
MRPLFPLLVCALLAGKAQAQTTYQFFYGNLHAHTSYSDGSQDEAASGVSTPLQSYQFASASQHFDFLGISEHNHAQAGMHLADFAKGRAQAVQATTDKFVALFGTEWGVISGGGHMLLYGISKLYGWESGNYDVYVPKNNYQVLMRKINKVPGAFALFAHPSSGDYGNLAGSAAFSSTADSALVGTPLRSGPALSTNVTYSNPSTGSYEGVFRAMLAKGYHVGISLDHDNHNTTFGRTTDARLVVLAPTLTEADLLSALRARRFYASDDWNAQVTLSVGGQPMGSIITSPDPAAVSVSYADGDNEKLSTITLMRGVPGSAEQAVSVATVNSGTPALNYTDPALTGTAYYYAILTQADGDRIVTSPIWYTRAAALASMAPQERLSVDVFPNPTAGGAPATLSYYLPATASVSSEVVDEVGRSVLTLARDEQQGAGPHTLTIPTQTLQAGIYTIRLRHNGASEYRKLVVTR